MFFGPGSLIRNQVQHTAVVQLLCDLLCAEELLQVFGISVGCRLKGRVERGTHGHHVDVDYSVLLKIWANVRQGLRVG